MQNLAGKGRKDAKKNWGGEEAEEPRGSSRGAEPEFPLGRGGMRRGSEEQSQAQGILEKEMRLAPGACVERGPETLARGRD